MGILDNFEKGLERAVNGAFAKTFRSGLQPVEISSALKRELDTTAAVVSRDRILVPNSFRVLVGTSDFQRMKGLGPTLVDELTQVVQKHAAAQSFQFAGSVSVTMVEQPRLSAGLLEIESSTIQRDVTWNPVLDVAGKRYPLTRARTVIGRGREADITVEDTGISRKHIEILWDGKHAQARDLDSTNGSQLNGQTFTRSVIEPDSVIQIGRTRVVFRVLAQAADTTAFAEASPPQGAPKARGEAGSRESAPDVAAAPARPGAAAPAAVVEAAAAAAAAEHRSNAAAAGQSAVPPAATGRPGAAPARKTFPATDPPRRAKRAPLKPKPAAEERPARSEKPAADKPVFPLDEPAPEDRQPPEPGGFRWNL